MNRILFICPRFNGYEEKIKTSFSNDFNVTSLFYDEIDFFKVRGLKKIIIVIFRMLFQLTSLRVFESIKIWVYRFKNRGMLGLLKQLKLSEIRYVFVVKGFGLKVEDIEYLRCKLPKANFIFYQWDSFKIYKYERLLCEKFDKVYSFQLEDCDDTVSYLPNPHYLECNKIEPRQVNGIFYIGIFSFQRYSTLKKISKKCKEMDIKYNFNLYTPNILLNKIGLKFIVDYKISHDDVLKMYKKYGAVVDLGQSNQSGLTQRFFDALSLGCSVLSFSPDAPGNFKSMILTSEQFFKGHWLERQEVIDCEIIDFINSNNIENWKKEIFKFRDEK